MREMLTQFLTKDGLPASNPPWGYSKTNLVTGKIEWKAAHGDLKINNIDKKIGTTVGGTALMDLIYYFY